ncbi:hypothetical protein [Robiginitalea sp. SC105]|uniref:hypothetical protein n=1 Tax=Robiginitalea sp. SC105 TaxID=2762332 RepID=UPI002105C6EB|nr:hypothetical protein [Robiginitalea sp. SC105]
MKKSFGIFSLLALFVTTISMTTSPPASMHSLQGTWELESFCNYADNVCDTANLQEGYRQVKMYYNGKVMWSRTDPNDTIGRFGFGSYHITTDELIENIEYGDHYFMETLGPTEFRFQLILGDNTYSQVTLDEEGNPEFSENYKRID